MTERLDLARWRDMRVSKFSKGMNERLAFAQALVHEPEFVFLDEPTDGLDPMGRREVRKICRELADSGKTVFINSHILAEIELICDRIALMKAGQIIEQGTIAELTSNRGAYEVVVPIADGLGDWLRERASLSHLLMGICMSGWRSRHRECINRRLESKSHRD